MWIVNQIEAAGLEPHVAHPLQGKKRTAGLIQTDQTDAAGLALLLRNGTLPEVWIASPAIRDLRGLVRSRLALRRHQTAFKNRIHGLLNQYGLKEWVGQEEEVDIRDWFSVKTCEPLRKAIENLPSARREAIRGISGGARFRGPDQKFGISHSSAGGQPGLDAAIANSTGRGFDPGRDHLVGDRQH